MILNISNKSATVISRGVYYFCPYNYPKIAPYELKSILDFIDYEEKHGRQTEIVCENAEILAAVNDAAVHPETVINARFPDEWETEFAYHATDIDAAKQILSSGRLLSAVKAYGKTGEELSNERSATLWNDPPDFFEYIMMFFGGDRLGGDLVVNSENPNGSFSPGVRFYFRYADILQHPGRVFDGYHAVKVKDEIVLSDYLYACIVPEQYKHQLKGYVLPELTDRVYYLPQDGLDMNQWSEKVCDLQASSTGLSSSKT